MHRLMALHYITASEITKSYHIPEETVVNCFRYCGMQATGTKATEDSFADLDENEAQLEDLVEQLHPDDCMTATEYAEV